MRRKWIVILIPAMILGIILAFVQWNGTSEAQSNSNKPNKPQREYTNIESPGSETLTGEEDSGVKKYELTAEPVTQQFTDGFKAKGWGFDGSIPGPTLAANEGDTVEITVNNNLPEATSIHWHGLEVPNDMDGVPMVQDTPKIEPGESYTYKFKLEQSGTYMYHSHTNVSKQELAGLTGSFVIQPKEQSQQVDRDITMMLQEWTLDGAGGHGDMNMDGEEDHQMNAEESETEEMENDDVYDIDPMGMEPNMFTINGKSYPSTKPIKVKKGETVRIRFTNLSGNSHPMHMHGDDFKVTSADGNRISKSAQLEKNTINVAAGETWDIEFTAKNTGTWPIHCHKPHHTMNADGETGGMFTVIEVVE